MTSTRILYNDRCPICRAEIAHYRKRAEAAAAPLSFEDLNTADLGDWALTADQAKRRLHAALPDGRIVSGIPAMLAIAGVPLIEPDRDDLARPAGERRPDQRQDLPPGVEVFQLRGPLFFGVSTKFADVLGNIARPPKVLVLRMREVPMMDASGAGSLGDLLAQCRRRGTRVILSGLQPQPAAVLRRMHLLAADDPLLAEDLPAALAEARRLLG